ncbi:MAG: acetoacetyl-[acyl-carrier protein] synthase [Candidatus Azotimanducaceae bacterium]
MSRLPVIVGFGGINPAGRSSGHHGYRRLVIDQLGAQQAGETWQSLAALMALDGPIDEASQQFIRNHTLVRKLENNLFDPANILAHKSASLGAAATEPLTFVLKRNQLPDTLPPHWQVKPIDAANVMVTTGQDLEIMFPDSRISKVNSGGQLPTGFNPEKLYQSRNHPRGLQLTVYAASDAINSLGFDWDLIRQKVPADQISVYASSAMGQLDFNGAGGMLQASLMGKRVSSKNCALSLAEMTADFVNAYILGSVGTTGANVGACATFLYNLRQGIQDIRSGKSKAVIVGASEAPLTPEVIEGYRTMGALAEDEGLRKLDGSSSPDHNRACRPFGDNCGFTLAEGSQFIVLFDDELALEMGAHIYGSVADVFINADGFKKSIPGPGIGNYITVGKALGVVRSILGEQAMQRRTYIQAHGTGTPQNRITESHIFNEMAKTFGLEKWPVAAIKSYLGHSLATAAGDQIAASLGAWDHGIIPGVKTIERIADDVHHSHLDILLDHHQFDPTQMDATLINSKGFGGNNATATLLSPSVTRKMLEKKHGKSRLLARDERNAAVESTIRQYDAATTAGKNALIYNFGVGVIEGAQLTLSDQAINIPGFTQPISMVVPNPYKDMSPD